MNHLNMIIMYNPTGLGACVLHYLHALWGSALHGAQFTCGASQVLLAGVSGGFSQSTPFFAPL